MEIEKAYKFKNCYWNNVFVVPADIFDKFLLNTSELEFKVLMLIFKNPTEINLKKISKILNISTSIAENILNYWVKNNILESVCLEVNKDEFIKTENATNVLNIDSPLQIREIKRSPTRYQRPDSRYVSKRINESADFKALIGEAEIILGRPLSPNDVSSLLMLHDNDGLPIDVILMIIQYAAENGKTNMRYIEKVGISWAEEGINSHEEAEDKIKNLSEFNMVWRNFENIIGINHRAPSSKEKEIIWRWFKIWNFNDALVKEAYERCVNKNGKYVLKYMDSILARWNRQGLTTIEQALSENISRNKKDNGTQKASYDIHEYENYNIFEKMGWDEINSMIKGV